MSSLLKKFNLKYKTFSCPSCQRSLRIPIKLGKMLRVTCPGCKSQFNISFKNPILSMFKWDTSSSTLSNLYSFFKRFHQLPVRAKLTIILFIASLIYLSISFYQGKQIKSIDTPTAPQAEQFLL